MPITVTWYDDHETIALTTFSGEWTLDEFHDILSQGIKMSGNKQEPFVSIADFTKTMTPPRKIISIGQRVNTVHNPNSILLIIVRPGVLIEMLYNTLRRLYPRGFAKAEIADSLEEALEIAYETLSERVTNGSH